MRLTEVHIIKPNNRFWKECDRLCFASKNLYNYALYLIKNKYKSDGEYLNFNVLDKLLSTQNQVDYRKLPSKVSQQTLMKLDKNFKSYFEALKKYNKNKESFTGQPKPPKFLNKTKGRYEVIYTQQAISKKQLKNGFICPSQTEICIRCNKNVQQFKISPMKNGCYKVQVIYLVDDMKDVDDNGRYVGIDIGLNNLATVVSNCDLKPFIINGKPLKSINQYYNKKLAKMKSELPFYKDNKKGIFKQRSRSKKIEKLTIKRNFKVDDYIHKASRKMVNILKQNNISKVVIGKNKQWKTEINIGSENNQKFVSIPHSRFIDIVSYKLKLVGIDMIVREESYTSKCSFLDNELIGKHEEYMGRRVSRGTFKTSKGIKWNADCNGSANILVKEISDAFANGIEVVVVPPVRIKI